MFEQIVIVGAGQAAVQAIDTLRRKGFTGKLAVVGDEPWLPYQRPPLSKKYLAGALERDRLLIRPAQFFADHAVKTHLGRRVAEIAPQRSATCASMTASCCPSTRCCSPPAAARAGSRCPAAATCRACTSCAPSPMSTASAPTCAAGRRLVIIGGGYIGLEVAATARELGLDVTVLEMAERVMNRVTCPRGLGLLRGRARAPRRAHPLQRERARAARRSRSGRVRAVLTEDGAEYPADLVIDRRRRRARG